MRTKLTCLFVIISFVATAQFRIQPQIGMENSRTTVKVNNLSSFAPQGLQFAPRLGMRMEYKFKKGHGPFLGLATSSPYVGFNFTDPQSANTNYYTTKQNLQLRFEGGYQVSSKPIYFSKPVTVTQVRTFSYNGESRKCGSSERTLSSANTENLSSAREGCSHPCQKSCTKNNSQRTVVTRTQSKGWFMRIVPSAGVAVIPTVNNDIEASPTGASQTNYKYKAGAWNTAFITGAGFEFGVNTRTKFILNANYLKGLGNLDTKTINHISNGKSVTTNLKSNTSSWNVSLGIPISFTKQKSATVIKHCEKIMYQGRCGQHYKIYQQ